MENTTNAPLSAINDANLLYTKLDEAQLQEVQRIADTIDEKDRQAIVTYGADAQKELTNFSQEMLDHVQNKELDGIGDTLSDLMYRLQEANPNDLVAENNNIFRRIFGRVKKSIYETTAKYQKIGAQVDNIAERLDGEKDKLLEDNNNLSVLYDKNKTHYDNLSLYIAAGEVKLAELNEKTIPAALEAASQSHDQMQMQEVADLQQFTERLEKRTHDLRLARQMTIQQAPQIRLIQNTNQALAEKIQASVHTAIPLWKNQIAIALTLLRQKSAVTAQRQVSETTNDLLAKNAELLKISSIETAKENERGIIDIETLKKSQDSLIQTIEEVLRIQKDGRIKRQEAELEIIALENNMREHLLQFAQQDSEQ